MEGGRGGNQGDTGERGGDGGTASVSFFSEPPVPPPPLLHLHQNEGVEGEKEETVKESDQEEEEDTEGWEADGRKREGDPNNARQESGEETMPGALEKEVGCVNSMHSEEFSVGNTLSEESESFRFLWFHRQRNSRPRGGEHATSKGREDQKQKRGKENNTTSADSRGQRVQTSQRPPGKTSLEVATHVTAPSPPPPPSSPPRPGSTCIDLTRSKAPTPSNRAAEEKQDRKTETKRATAATTDTDKKEEKRAGGPISGEWTKRRKQRRKAKWVGLSDEESDSSEGEDDGPASPYRAPSILQYYHSNSNSNPTTAPAGLQKRALEEPTNPQEKKEGTERSPGPQKREESCLSPHPSAESQELPRAEKRNEEGKEDGVTQGSWVSNLVKCPISGNNFSPDPLATNEGKPRNHTEKEEEDSNHSFPLIHAPLSTLYSPSLSDDPVGEDSPIIHKEFSLQKEEEDKGAWMRGNEWFESSSSFSV